MKTVFARAMRGRQQDNGKNKGAGCRRLVLVASVVGGMLMSALWTSFLGTKAHGGMDLE